MKDKHINENVDVVILPGIAGKTYNASDTRKIQGIVRNKLLLTSKEPYHKVQVEVVHGADGSPKALVVTMLRAHTYTADIQKINVDHKYNILSIESNSNNIM